MTKLIENIFKKMNTFYFRELSKYQYSDMEIMICGKKNKKIYYLVEARVNSSRLKNKVLKNK